MNGSLRETFGTYVPGGGGSSGGSLAIEDGDPQIASEVLHARREAALAQPNRDRARNKELTRNVWPGQLRRL